MLNKIQKLSELIKKSGIDYSHIYFEDKQEFFTEGYKGKFKEKEINLRGISILIYKNNASGFAATSDLTNKGIQQMIDRAYKKIDMHHLTPKININLDDVNFKYKFKHYHRQFNDIKDLDTKILTSEIIHKKIISNNGELPIEKNIHYGSLICEILNQHQLFERCQGWVDKLDNIIPTLYKLNDEVVQIKEKYISPIEISDSKSSLLFKNLATGMLFHEIVHLFEMRENGFQPQINNVNNKLTVYNNPTQPKVFGGYKYDDEGVSSQKICLIRNGQIENLIKNSFSEKYIVTNSKGHGRREDFRYRPHSRMSNVEVVSGEFSFDQLLSHTKNGVYIQKISAGNANHTNGQINLKVEEAFEIKDGQIGKTIKPFLISGTLGDFLSNIELIGNDLETLSISCKGSSGIIPVSLTQPSILINNLNIYKL